MAVIWREPCQSSPPRRRNREPPLRVSALGLSAVRLRTEDVSLPPELQHQQVPNLIAVIGGAGIMRME